MIDVVCMVMAAWSIDRMVRAIRKELRARDAMRRVING